MLTLYNKKNRIHTKLHIAENYNNVENGIQYHRVTNIPYELVQSSNIPW